MQDVRNNDSNEGRNAPTADSSGIAITDGGNVRSNDRSESPSIERNSGIKSAAISNVNAALAGTAALELFVSGTIAGYEFKQSFYGDLR